MKTTQFRSAASAFAENLEQGSNPCSQRLSFKQWVSSSADSDLPEEIQTIGPEENNDFVLRTRNFLMDT